MGVVVLGSANLDLIVEVGALPAPGRTVLGGDVLVRPGGKGANQAVAALRLGAGVVLAGATGRDEFGRVLRAGLLAHGLDLTHLREVDAPTGVALIVVDRDGENTITVAPGANGRVDAATLDRVDLDGDTVLLTQLEIPVGTCLAAAERARRAGGRVIVNAAPPPDRADARLSALLELTDVLVVNQSEALALADRPDAADWGARAADLQRLGPPTVVITLGAQGAVGAEGDDQWAVAAPTVTAIDATGAGDAFCGALAAGLAAGRPLASAVARACAAGALATTAFGAQEGLPTADELDAFLARRPRR
jgi:ribokinase